jgi:Cd2+/Zn2+-exporting ATPase
MNAHPKLPADAQAATTDAPLTLAWTVSGMDCASCAAKIRGAVERLPGVGDVALSVMSEKLSLTLAPGGVEAMKIEAAIKALGYGVTPLAVKAAASKTTEAIAGASAHEHGPGCDHDHAHDDHKHDGQSHAGHDHAGCGLPGIVISRFRVEGMDCGSCAAKIEGAVKRMPGVQSASASVGAGTLKVEHMAAAGFGRVLAQTLRPLGFVATPLEAAGSGAPAASAEAGHDHGDGAPSHSHDHAPTPPGKRWFQTAKGQLVIGTGALLAGAWASKFFVAEATAYWAFVAACLIAVVPVARRAFAAARLGQPFTIETLMTIATAGALAIGAAEEAALVVFLFAVGEVLEGVAADRARASIRALGDLIPKTALLETDGAVQTVSAGALQPGQVVRVRPGDRVPCDGEVIEGTSGVDEAPVSGESVPKTKMPGDAVFAGSINAEALLRVRVTKAAEDNTIARIIRLVEEAQEAKAPTERFIDRFSRIYMPIVVALAVLTMLVPPLAMGGEWGTWIYRGIALLLIGCPCALVISVPASIASSLSAGARRGLLMKGGVVIEAAAKADVIAFDKTGTLTLGKPKVTDVAPFGATTRETLLALAAGVEAGSSHPLAQAVLSEAEAATIKPLPATAQRAIPGRGVEAKIGGETIFVGSPRSAAEMGVLGEEAKSQAERLEGEGKTVAAVMRAGVIVGLIALRDEPREDAAQAVSELKELGVRSIMLTGDNRRTGEAIAAKLGMEARAELMPDDKVAEIKRLAAAGRVMMIGDGINDAPALAAAQIGVAMGSGTDVALETADAALMRSRVTDAPRLIRLARATMGNIRTNIAIALGLKAVFLVTSVIGYTGLWVAILADTGATVLVTLNALRLLAFNPDARPKA